MPLTVRFMLLSYAAALLALAPRHVSAASFQADASTPTTCAALPLASSPGFETKLESFMAAYCYRTLGWKHDSTVRSSNGVHPFVKIYYSPQMWRWMTVDHRQGTPQDGAMIVKEQYPELSSDKISDWTIMVRDSGASHDGWYWADLEDPNNASASSSQIPAETQLAGACPPAAFPSIGFGVYCLNCHASAANANTYSNPNLSPVLEVPSPTSSALPDDNIHHRLARKLFQKDTFGPARCMVPESFDHVVPRAANNTPNHFVTSDQCSGCHDATGTLSPTRFDLPRMLWPNALADPMADVSPSGEWRFSMMGLSGRDPIFFSQLSSENALHPTLEGHGDKAQVFVQDLCLSCHGVMGQRLHDKELGGYLKRADLLDPKSPYGALARDGISCAACHHIAADGLGDPETFTGKFNLGPVDELYGPYQHDVSVLPMKNALGITPKATAANQIESSKLCGSCHTIVLPVFESSGRRFKRNGKDAEFYEQTTYLEWLNSSFLDRSCQSCHMQKDFKGNPLSYKIANIEDNTFPSVEFRAPNKDITLVERDDFHRHTLLGINIFALEMFKQFRAELGLYEVNPLLRTPAMTTPGIDNAIATSTDIASRKSAELEVQSFSAQDDRLVADVKVTNLAGHSFPSGVGFRRAFVNLQLLDADNRVLWESGRTDSEGVILNGSGGGVLKTEFFSPQQQEIQSHHWRDNPIEREDQVQIYEELVRNPEGFLSTSFIALDRKAKDNRLQPRGWSASGPYADETGPVGTCVTRRDVQRCDPQYTDGSGSSVVRYRIRLNPRTARATHLRATLYYQSIPPYYLRQRATDGQGIDTDRLIRFSHELSLENTPVKNWKLPIAVAEKTLDGRVQLTEQLTATK